MSHGRVGDRALGVVQPSDAELYGFQWHHHRHYSWLAWERSQSCGATVKVAVLDTGVSPVPTLPNVALDEGANFIDPGASALDDHGHGTHMASIIASRGALWGVAPRATIVPIKVLDEHKVGTEAALIEGLYYAASVVNVDVVSMSLTFPPGYRPSKALTDAVEHVAAQGIIMVAAAGNDGVDEVAYPARFPQVIAVGAARLEATPHGLQPVVADYSNRGVAVDVVAFGGDLSQDLDEDGVPDGILGESLQSAEAPSGLVLIAGTSPAAAQVAGAAALLIDAGVPNADVRQRLRATARPMDALAFDDEQGQGLVHIGAAMPEAPRTFEAESASQRLTSTASATWGNTVDDDVAVDHFVGAGLHGAMPFGPHLTGPARVVAAPPLAPDLAADGGCSGGALPPPWAWLLGLVLLGWRRDC